MGAMARKHTVARNKPYLEKSQCHLPTLRMQFDYGYHFEGVVVEKVQVSLVIADLEKSQCHLHTFKCRLTTDILWALMLIVQDSGSGLRIPLLLCLISGS